MAIRFLDKNTFIVQVQRGGARKTRRGTGTQAIAERVEKELTEEVERERKLDDAARLLGVNRAETAKPVPKRHVPTLREFFEKRWVEHAKVVQNQTTLRAQRTSFAYLLIYLGDKPLDELVRRIEVNAFIEAMKKNGQIPFQTRQDGKPVARRTGELKHATINKTLQCLKALLNLAHDEEVIAEAPRIDLLPQDDSVAVIPPTEEQLQLLLAACEKYREVSPLLPEVVEFASETGLRRAEVFHLTWASVDLARSAIRVEMKMKSRVANGKHWKPKHGKNREVPLSRKAKAILERRLAGGPLPPDEDVFPNRGGCPYERMDGAPIGSGQGYFPLAVGAAGLRGKVSFHGLRHMFAVRLLTKGVPITVVSELLGHSSIQLTVKRYGRYASDARVKWDAVRVLDAPEATMSQSAAAATAALATAAPASAASIAAPTALPRPAAPTAANIAAARRLVALDGGRR